MATENGEMKLMDDECTVEHASVCMSRSLYKQCPSEDELCCLYRRLSNQVSETIRDRCSRSVLYCK